MKNKTFLWQENANSVDDFSDKACIHRLLTVNDGPYFAMGRVADHHDYRYYLAHLA